MHLRTIILLIVSSAMNLAIGAGSFLFAGFATSPTTADVTMRAAFYVLGVVSLSAFACTIAPWVLVLRKRHRTAVAFALLPAFLVCLAVVLFLTLDSWLQRSFSG